MTPGLSWGIASVIGVLALIAVIVIFYNYYLARKSERQAQRLRSCPGPSWPPVKLNRSSNKIRRSDGSDVELDDEVIDMEDVVEHTGRAVAVSEIMEVSETTRSAPVDNFEPVRTESSYSGGGSYDSGGGGGSDD